MRCAYFFIVKVRNSFDDVRLGGLLSGFMTRNKHYDAEYVRWFSVYFDGCTIAIATKELKKDVYLLRWHSQSVV